MLCCLNYSIIFYSEAALQDAEDHQAVVPQLHVEVILLHELHHRSDLMNMKNTHHTPLPLL